MLTEDIRFALDPVSFALVNLHFSPDPWQARVLRAVEKRILLNCCRQAGKSSVAAIMALHRVLFHPCSLVLLVSPSLRKSSELFRKVMDFMKALPSRPRMVEENKLSLQLENGSRIVSLPGDEANIRGYSNVSLIIEDEASRVSDDLYRAIRPMLAVSGGRLILLSTPFGKRGHFYEEWEYHTEAEGGEAGLREPSDLPTAGMRGVKVSLSKPKLRVQSQEGEAKFILASTHSLH